MSKNYIEAVVGALVIVVAAFFVTFTYSRTEAGTSGGYELTARFESVDGISVGSDVRIAGIKVGSITKQVLDPETFMAVVHFTVNKEIKIHGGASIKVSSDGLLGGGFLSLSNGFEDYVLEDGDEIEITQGSVSLTELIGQAVFSATDNSDEKK